jgi:uncharacterized damage-inducible protein DinB
MITPAYVQMMARYNQWQNDNLTTAAAQLRDDQRKEEGGAFFGTIHATFNHLIWADRYWMYRFTGSQKPPGGMAQSRLLYEQWDDLLLARATLDQTIIAWADGLDPAWLETDISWFSGSKQKVMAQPIAQAVTHVFNHQTHHRGQIHALLTRFGVVPQDTDLVFMELGSHKH